MLTLAALLRLTPKPILHRAYNECSVRLQESSQKKDADGDHKFFLGSVKADDGDRVVTIKFYAPWKVPLAESKVWLHCSCPYHTFTVEKTNSKLGSSDVLLSNGQEPVVRNPKNIPHLCKHLVAFAKVAVLTRVQAEKEAPPKPGEKSPQKPGQPTPPKPGLKPLNGPKPIPGIKPMTPAQPGAKPAGPAAPKLQGLPFKPPKFQPGIPAGPKLVK